MKPILMLGTAAYSPFRLDAIRAALGTCNAALSKVEIEARWVYAIQSEAACAPSAETLDRAALAKLIFANECARKALEGIIHPLVQRNMLRAMDAAAEAKLAALADELMR